MTRLVKSCDSGDEVRGTTSVERSTAALQATVDGVEAGVYRPSVERVFQFGEIVEAHRVMEENRASGKLVVVMPS